MKPPNDGTFHGKLVFLSSKMSKIIEVDVCGRVPQKGWLISFLVDWDIGTLAQA